MIVLRSHQLCADSAKPSILTAAIDQFNDMRGHKLSPSRADIVSVPPRKFSANTATRRFGYKSGAGSKRCKRLVSSICLKVFGSQKSRGALPISISSQLRLVSIERDEAIDIPERDSGDNCRASRTHVAFDVLVPAAKRVASQT